MKSLILFIIGLMIGGFITTIIMCSLTLHKLSKEDNDEENTIEEF